MKTYCTACLSSCWTIFNYSLKWVVDMLAYYELHFFEASQVQCRDIYQIHLPSFINMLYMQIRNTYACIYIYTHISEAVVSFRWRSGNIFLFTRIAYSFYAAEYNLLRVDNTTPSKQTISNYPPRWREGGWGVNNSAMRGRWPIRFMENRFSSLIMNAYRAYRREFIFCVKWTVFDIPKI